MKEWERDVNEQNLNQRKENKDLTKNPSDSNSNSVALSGASGVTLSSNMEEVLRGGKSMAVLILGEDNVAIFDPRLSGVKEFDWKQAQADNITATFPALIKAQMVVVDAAKTISEQDSNATKATLERYSWYRYNSTSGKAVDTRTSDDTRTSEEGKGPGKGKGKATAALANRSITAAYRQGTSRRERRRGEEYLRCREMMREEERRGEKRREVERTGEEWREEERSGEKWREEGRSTSASCYVMLYAVCCMLRVVCCVCCVCHVLVLHTKPGVTLLLPLLLSPKATRPTVNMISKTRR